MLFRSDHTQQERPSPEFSSKRFAYVNLDGNNLTPYSLNEVVKLLKDREVKATSLPSDHHEERLKGEQLVPIVQDLFGADLNVIKTKFQ